MNKFNVSHVFLLAVLGLLTSTCTKELPFPEVKDAPVIVVNSLFSPDETIQVHVSESCHITVVDCRHGAITNADVRLLDEAGQLIVMLNHQSEGIYTSETFEIKNDQTYQLEVSAGAQLQSITTKSSVPNAVNANLLAVEERFFDDRLVWAFEIEIEDDPSTENYYVIEANLDGDFPEDYFDFISEVNGYVEPHFGHLTDDPNADNNKIAQSADFIPFPLRAVYLTDRNFNGSKYKTVVGLYTPFERGLPLDVMANISVKSVSKEMYDYMISLEDYRTRTADPFSEPQQVYSNIKDGIGIFAGFAQTKISQLLPESEYALPSEILVENNGCTAPCTVKFSMNGGSELNYTWDFGDGTTAQGPMVEHQYEEAGTYLVSGRAETTDRGSFIDVEVTIR